MENLFSNFNQIPGVGGKTSELLVKLTGSNRVVDLLYHLPSNVVDKNYLPKLYQIQDKELVIVKVRVEAHLKPANNRQPFRVRCFSPTGYLNLIFFKIFPNYIEKNFPLGAEIVVSGTIERHNGEWQMAHPDYVVPLKLIDKIPKVSVIYPLIAGVGQKLLRDKVKLVLEKTPELPEWIDSNLIKQQLWKGWKESLASLHNPQAAADSNPCNINRRRLAFDELLAAQIAALIAKKYLVKKTGRKIIANNTLRKKLLASLPFSLTKAQEKVLAEIDLDLGLDKKMLRLLQGDVGSGKTIVAMLAMLAAVENKSQAAIIVPITLLALQHFKNFQVIAEKIGIKIAVLTSKTTKKNKQKVLDDLKNGDIDILIGTHALLEPDIVFKDLALIVIDEQHRFGVLQRLKLVEKGNNADVLLMSATPIPRSLMMTFYGDMEVSILNQKPQNRLAIDTRVISQDREQEIYQAISRAVASGEKIYWICPLIDDVSEESSLPGSEEKNDNAVESYPPYLGGFERQKNNEVVFSEKGLERSGTRGNHSVSRARGVHNNPDLSDVTNRYQQFKKQFGEEKVGMIHGQMNDKEKDSIMNEFITGNIQILVATSVIEVGIDVRDATIMVIENCEQFGLSQLHQLRGRVGRGNKKSYCLLVYGKKVGMMGKKRLGIMRESDDGFVIAEEDLKMRGAGQMLGTKQSGLPEYKVADLNYDLDLLNIANRYAKFLLEKKDLDRERLKILLRIFNYDECLKLIYGG